MNARSGEHYHGLLSGTRARASSIPSRTLAEEVYSDRGRVIFSSPFRKLQNKAQVFSLERNAIVRSRLTHSLEVSSIGRYIAQLVNLKLSAVEDGEVPVDVMSAIENDRVFVAFVEVACLLHDIGNPPFGHFGERAIGEWFQRQSNRRVIENGRSELTTGHFAQRWQDEYLDFTKFDGNPQGLRTISRLQPRFDGDQYGLNLTLTTLAATIKYPWTSADAAREKRKKFGFFMSEIDLYERMTRELGLKKGCRHPIVYLVEAADDIAYCLSDIEDGIEKSLVTIDDLKAYLEQAWQGDAVLHDLVRLITRPYTSMATDAGQTAALQGNVGLRPYNNPIQEFRGVVIRKLTDGAAQSYVDNHEKVMSGGFGDLLREGSHEDLIFGGLKGFAEKRLYSSAIVRSREITAFKVIHGILDAYRPLLGCDKKRFLMALDGKIKDDKGTIITVEPSLLSRIPESITQAYYCTLSKGGSKHEEDYLELVARMHLVVDYVAGMTDEDALETYQLISGMKIDPRL